ncbi:MAG: L,D-transpeptidase [Candidatus Latescibacterota bacterium]|nr:L,D-transpeptidase [Candidatus Latescibacterota bacterium]
MTPAWSQPDLTPRAELIAEHRSLLAQLQAHKPRTPYLVISTVDNRVLLRDPTHRIDRDAVAATGAPRRFESPDAWKPAWNFATPKGRFEVLRKVVDPIWVKPEWAFLESGEEVPVFAEDPRRIHRGVLGEYALYFLKDYMIHGTLYEVNLGKSITHGCVRVSSADLRYLYERVRLGWPVYVY